MSTKNIREPRFIFSTDYLHLADAGTTSKIITIPAMTISANDSTANGYVDVDFPTPNDSKSFVKAFKNLMDIYRSKKDKK